MLDYAKLGFRCGIEIHQQLATENKLFCNCSAAMSDPQPVFEIKRRMRPVAGEMGDVDAAAAFETLMGKTFRYKVYLNETCLVELDEGDLIMTTDFRRVYASVLGEWLGAPQPAALLRGDFAPMGLIG